MTDGRSVVPLSIIVIDIAGGMKIVKVGHALESLSIWHDWSCFSGRSTGFGRTRLNWFR